MKESLTKIIIITIAFVLFVLVGMSAQCVPPPPVPTVAFNPANPCGGYDVTITASPANPNMTYMWTFDDGSMDTLFGDVVIHDFPRDEDGATYNIQLTVIDEDGCTSDATTPITTAPTPDFEVMGNFSACLPSFSTQTTFTTVFQVEGGVPGAEYNWFFGDGEALFNSADTVVTHTYGDYGTYNLVVQSSNGSCLGSFEQEVKFYLRPTADMNIVGDPDICEGDSIEVENNTDPSQVLFYVWDWGDGTRDTVYDNNNYFYEYEFGDNAICNNPPQAGYEYQVTLYAVNDCLEHTNESPIFVSLMPRAAPQGPGILCEGNPTATFGNESCPSNSSGYFDPNFYYWDFGDGTTSNLESPTHTFGGPGTYTVVLVANNSCGTVVDSVEVVVLEDPQAEAAATFSDADGNAIFGSCVPFNVNLTNLSTGDSITSYLWTIVSSNDNTDDSGWSYINGTDSTSFEPELEIYLDGTYNIQLTLESICGTSIWDTTLQTIGLPLVELDPIPDFCDEGSITPTYSLNLANGTLTNIQWQFPGGTPNSSSDLNPSDIYYDTPGTYDVTVSVENECGFSSSTVSFTVLETQAVDAGPDMTFCINDDPFTFTPNPTGGAYAGPGITSDGIFTPLFAGEGVHEITYADLSLDCPIFDTLTVTVLGLPIVDAGPPQSLCISEGLLTLVGASPLGGTWSGSGVVDPVNGVFDPELAGVGSFNLIYTYTDGDGCVNTDFKVVEVIGLPVVNAGGAIIFCDIPENLQITGYSPAGGTWEGPGIVDENAGLFNPVIAGGIGTYEAVYSYTDVNGCSNMDTLEITVQELDIVSAGPDLEVCIDEPQFDITGQTPPGGSWSGPGIIDAGAGTFYAQAAGVGNHELIYTVGAGSCAVSDTMTVFISALPTVAAGVDETWCVDAPPYTFGGFSPAGGTWSGTGVTDPATGAFDIQLAGVGTHVLTYSYTDPLTGCSNEDDKVVVVLPLPVVDAGGTVTYCDTPDDVPLTGYSPLGGSWSGDGIVDPTNGVFNPAGAGGVGTYEVIYSYTNNNGCSNADTLTIEIVAPPVVEAGGLDTICIDNGNYTITGYSPAGGVWTGPGIVDGNAGIFSPDATGVGVFTLTYTYGEGTCEQSDTKSIYVSPLPTVNPGENVEVCEDATAFPLQGFFPSDGTWTGMGITDPSGVFDPQVTGPGVFPVTLSYTDPNTGCSDEGTINISVYPLPIVNAGDTTTYCLTEDNIVLDGYSPLGGTWTGLGIVDPVNGIFNVDVAGGVGQYDLTYTYTNSNGCTNSDDLHIVIVSGEIIVAGPNDTICIDNGLHVLSGYTPPGGSWSGTGIIDPNGGVFDPQVSGVGLHTLTYTIGTGTCLRTATKTVFVGALPPVEAGDDEEMCEDATAYALTGQSPTNGGIWSGTGVTPGGDFDPQIAGVGTHTLTYSYTNPTTGCDDFDTKNITINPLPAVFAGDTVTYCNTEDNITLTGYSPLGGSWSGTGIIDPANGVFSPILAGGIGTHDVLYTFVDNNGCENMDTLTIELIYGDTINAGPDTAICITYGFYTLQGWSPYGGTWSGPGIVNPQDGVFDPVMAGPGVHTLTYTYGTGTCLKTDTKDILVGNVPIVNPGPNESGCSADAPYQLMGFAPVGGYWEGPGVDSSGFFTPAFAGPGTHTLTYTYVNPVTGCEASGIRTITLDPAPTVEAGPDITICDNPSDLIFSGYSPLGGLWSGPGVIDAVAGIFNPGVAGGPGEYDITYGYVSDNGCYNEDSLTIFVLPPPVVEAGPDTSLCIDAGLFVMDDFSPAGGIWTGPGIISSGGVFDPLIAGLGIHILTYTYGEGTCQRSDIRRVLVGTPPLVNAGENETACEGDDPYQLTGFSPQGGFWTGVGITDSVGMFDPSLAGEGTHTLTYTYVNEITGCENSDTRAITISPLPTVTVPDNEVYCNTFEDISLGGYNPFGGIWTGPGIVDGFNGVFNPAVAGGIGNYELVYTYTSLQGCISSDTMAVEVVDGPVVSAGPDTAICIDHGLFYITEFSPAGGAWSGPGIISSAGVFDPLIAGEGLHVVTYTYGEGSCATTDTREIFVGGEPVVTAGPDEEACELVTALQMTGFSPPGGYWTGPSVDSTGLFNPSSAGLGTHFLTYNYTNPLTGCENSDIKSVTVVPVPVVYAGDTLTYCEYTGNITLQGSPAGGIWSGPGVLDPVAGVFNTGSAGGIGSYELFYTFAEGGGCDGVDSVVVNVVAAPVVDAGIPDTMCVNDGLLTLEGATPAGGTWSGTGIVDPYLGIFDPLLTGIGAHQVTYTYGEGSCEREDVRIIYVGALPNVDAGPDESLCADELAFNLTGQSPQGGFWSGPGITDPVNGTFDPQSLGVGAHLVTYTYINQVTGCDNSDSRLITILPLPNVYTPDSVTYCDSSTDIALTGYGPLGGTWSGPGIVNGSDAIFNTNLAGGIGDYELIYSYTDANGCQDTDTMQVAVIYGDTVIAGPDQTICIDEGLIYLADFSPAGGSWSGPGIIDPAFGIFDPLSVGAGAHTIYYTYGEGTCGKTDAKIITIATPPPVEAGTNQSVCEGSPAFPMQFFSPVGGYWTGPGVDSTGLFTPDSAGVGTHTLTYTFVNEVTGCENFDTKQVTVTALPNVYAGGEVLYCNSNTNITLTGQAPQGGTWSGPGILSETGVFNTIQAGGEGSYELLYSYTDANGCSNDDTLLVEVIYGDTVVAGPDLYVCIQQGIQILQGNSPAGGTWSGPGIIDPFNGLFDPFDAGDGTHTVYYTYGTGTCEKTDSRQVTVGLIPPVFAGNDNIVCEGSNAFYMSGYTPAGGVWTGVGITNPNGQFNPQVAGTGTHTLTYTYTHPVTGCENSDTKQVTVQPLPAVDAGGTITYCDSPDNISLEGYSPEGGVWAGPGIVNPNFGIFNTEDAGGIGTYELTYTYTDNLGCVNDDTLIVDVIYGDTVVAGPDLSICITDGEQILTGYSPLGGTWSGTGIVDAVQGVFDPAIAGTGYHTLTYTFGEGSCEHEDSRVIFVGGLPNVNAGPDEIFCEGGVTTFQLTNFSPAGGVWSGNGIVDAENGIFSPQGAGDGVITLTYTVTNTTTGCVSSDTKTITILPIPDVNVLDEATYCNTLSNIQLQGYAPEGGVWTGPGIVNGNTGVFNTSLAGGIGTYELIYTVSGDFGCTNQDTMLIQVIEGDTVEAGPNQVICIDEGIFVLPGFSPAGGLWTGDGIIDPVLGSFDPQLAGVGTHTLTYTYGEGTCQKSDTKIITIGGIPDVQAGPDQEVCVDAEPFGMQSFNPLGGVWTGVGIDSAGTFTPSTAGVGTHTLVYTYTNPITGCEDFDTKEITVHGLPNVFAGDDVVYCNTVNNIVLENYSPQGGTWNGPGIVDANGVFNTFQAGGEGTYTLTYTYSDINGCANSDTLGIEVIYGDTVYAGPNFALCITDGIQVLEGQSPAGGVWSGPGVTDAVAGLFDPVLAGNGVHTLSYTYGEGTCEKTDTRQVTIGTIPAVFPGPNQEVCEDEEAFTLTGFSPAGGIWTGLGITDPAGVFDPQIAGTGTHTITYTYVNPTTGCENSTTKTIIVNPLPFVDAGGDVTYCDTPANIPLTGYSPAGGIWSGPGVVSATQGVFNTETAGGIGTYELGYTYTDDNGCVNSDTLLVEVIYGDTVVAGPDFALCITDGIQTLEGQSPAGGTWTGAGITDAVAGTFDPELAGNGVHTLTYTYGEGTCLKTDTRQVTVGLVPTVFPGPNQEVCEDEEAFTLMGFSPAGGTWTGLGITDPAGVFDPQIAGTGTHTITYTYVNPTTGCENSTTKTIIVNPLPFVDAGGDVTFCDTDQNITLSGYTPAGGIWSGPGVLSTTQGVFNTEAAGGIGTYELGYTYTDDNGCVNSDTLLVEVIYGDTVQAGPDMNVCIQDDIITLGGYSPEGGTWSGSGIVDGNLGEFDPATAGTGYHILTYTYGEGTCEKTDTRTIFVGGLPNVNAGPDETFCEGVTTFTLADYSPAGGTWTGLGIVDGAAGVFDPQITGDGTFTLTYTYVNSVTGCEASDTKDITILPNPVVIVPDSVWYCNTTSNVQLEGYEPAGGVWQGPGIVNGNLGIFNPNLAGGEGTYYLAYNFTDNFGCSGSDTMKVDIIYGDTVVAGPDMALCITDGVQILEGQSPAGGTWSGPGIIDAVAGQFDPQVAGNGTHTLTYTYGEDTCEKSDTRQVTVGLVPPVYPGDNQLVCEDEPAFALDGFSPAGGLWYGNGIVDSTGVFDPQVAGVGTHPLTYVYIDPVTGCQNSGVKEIIVEPFPIVNAGGNVTYCDGPNDILLENYSPQGGVWSGPGILNPVFGVFNTEEAGGIGTYELVYTYVNANGCVNTDTLEVEVIYGDTVTAGPNVDMCILDGPLTLVGSPVGGTWSGIGIVNSSGIFDPGLAGAGTHTLTYTYGEGTCEKTDTRTIYVGDIPTVDAGPDMEMCINAPAFDLTGYGPAGGYWVGFGVDSTGYFDPAAAGVGVHGLTYLYQDPVSGCLNQDDRLITVNELPSVNAGDTVLYCLWDEAIQLTGYSPQGGTWSGPGIVDPVQGTFDTDLAGGVGAYTLTYSYMDENGCVNSDDLVVLIDEGLTIMAGPDEELCIDNGLHQLEGFSPTGGTWSGPGIVDAFNGVFDPVAAGPGLHELTYEYGTGTCVRRDYKFIEVHPLPFVEAGEDVSLCEGSEPYTLAGTPTGGTWSGFGIVEGTDMFDPQATGLGEFTLTYYYTNPTTGCSNLDTLQMQVTPLPGAAFEVQPEACVGEIVPFINNSLGADSYLWNFGDGTNSSLENPEHAYDESGTYTITLIAYSPEGCPDTATAQIVIIDPPVALFEPSVDAGCAPLAVNFANMSEGVGMSYEWDFGNGQTSISANPATVTYYPIDNETTTYTVSLTVTNQCGTDTYTDMITVSPTPVVEFGTDISEGCTPLPVNFTNITVGEADQYYWDFGNGVTSTDSIPDTQIFTADSLITTYTITLIATNECGADTATTQVVVNPASINSFFNADVTEGCQPLEVNFTNLATPGADVTWDFGDGNFSVLENPVHVFDTAGVFTVTQYAVNSCGIDSSSIDITVYPPSVVDFDMSDYSCVDNVIQFTNLSEDIVGSVWTFGDGDTSFLTNPTHVYDAPGTYEITLTGYSVTANCPATVTGEILIRENPEVAFTLDTLNGCSPVVVSFQNTSPIVGFSQWDFGDGNVSADMNPTHSYIESGTYTATLTNTDDWGCASDTSVYNIIVFPQPDASFDTDVEQLCEEGGVVTFTNTSEGASAFQWDFDNGYSTTFTDPAVSFAEAGIYEVTLIARNQYGCSDTIQQPFEVLETPMADLSITGGEGCEDLFVQFTQESENVDSYFWHFGDGNTSDWANPQHTYTEPGYYDVTLVAGYDEVCYDTLVVTNAVSVYDAPEANFEYAQGGEGVVSFNNLTVGASAYFWDFGDGTTSEEEHPIHRYDENGLRVVMLIAYAPGGCADTMMVEVLPEVIYGLYVPSAFSPEIGIGDVRYFKPAGIGLKNYHIQIFTPWGELMWESKELDEQGRPAEGWDGYHDGVIAPQGAYVWKVVIAEFIDGSNWEGMDYGDGDKRRVGSVNLLR